MLKAREQGEMEDLERYELGIQYHNGYFTVDVP